jgi:transposase-like protein
MFGLPDEIRPAVYATNAIEFLNMSLRKVIKIRLHSRATMSLSGLTI